MLLTGLQYLRYYLNNKVTVLLASPCLTELNSKGLGALRTKTDPLQKWSLFTNCIALLKQVYKIKVKGDQMSRPNLASRIKSI